MTILVRTWWAHPMTGIWIVHERRYCNPESSHIILRVFVLVFSYSRMSYGSPTRYNYYRESPGMWREYTSFLCYAFYSRVCMSLLACLLDNAQIIFVLCTLFAVMLGSPPFTGYSRSHVTNRLPDPTSPLVERGAAPPSTTPSPLS